MAVANLSGKLISESDALPAQMIRTELAERVQAAVASLPDHYRQVVVLCDLCELSYAEAASRLRCALGTIRSRLSRAHALLAEKLKPLRQPATGDRSSWPGGMSHMTCHELRVYFDDPLRMDAEFPGEAEHLAHCTECARFVEARRELGAGLRLVRESAPEPSAALEAAVLANYRRRSLAIHHSSDRGHADSR